MYLIAGLGNPGPKYRNTRHNIGFKIINSWCRSLDITMRGRRFQSRNACMQYQGKDDILVVHDDIDLQVGKIKVVRGGGAGGHKGVLSITHYLKSHAFPRVKIGVGRPRHGESIENFVLDSFYGDEKDIIKSVIPLAAKACEMFISKGIETTMNYINSHKFAN
ncbi:MAG: aminoacyl-tRNA hydrolase [Deltaproteobacteria bacterium]|nr:aminoacyl-tRNA hydrolase [Deltaproteobacteria bacterium]